MTCHDRELFVLSGGHALDSAVLELCWKAWTYADGAVYWELRRILHTLLNGLRRSLDVNVLAKNFLDDNVDFITGWQFSPYDIVVPSLRALAARGVPDVCARYVREEWSISTVGLLIWLVLWSEGRRSHEAREKCMACAKVLLVTCVDLSSWDGQVFLDHLRHEDVDGCPSLREGEWCCPHAQKVMALTDTQPGATTARQVIGLLQRLMLEDCPSTRRAFRATVKLLGAAIDKHAQEFSGSCDNATLAKLFHFGSKGTRLDEDVKNYVTNTMVKRRKIHSASQALRVLHTGCPTKVALDWEQKLVMETFLQSKASLQGNAVVWCMEDASRCGKPAEDVTVYMLWDAASGYACYPVPQAVVNAVGANTPDRSLDARSSYFW